MEIIVTKKFIRDATCRPTTGEKWFKGDELEISAFKQFVKPQFGDTFDTTFPTIYLQDHYNELLKVIQRYLTCEGRFNSIYQYHIRLLWHFIENKPMNLPFFLFKSLERMETKVQMQKNNHMSSLFHFPLIKILVKFAVDRRKIYWSDFLSSIGLQPQT